MTLAILSAPGSRGDVNPMIAIGRELRLRGCDVVISLAEPYVPLAEAAGLQSETIVSRQEFDQLLSDRRVWTAFGGVRRLLDGVAVPLIKRHQQVIDKHHRLGETVLVSHPLDLASRLFREHRDDVPLVDIHLAPSMLRDEIHPPRLLRRQPTRPAWLVRAAYWAGDKFVLDPVLGPAVHRVQKQNGAPVARRIFHHWWLSPDRILAMYPSWFADAWVSKYPQLETLGFPCEDIAGDDFDSAASVSTRPIVFTAGTAHHHCRRFFDAAVRTCVRLNHPGLLLSTHEENFPTNLPAVVRTATYLPLSRLLPSCAAIVHHGGIGTTSAALAAGIPQVIRPMAYDQFDNAARVERIGCGVWLRKDRDLAGVLRRLLGDASPVETDRLRRHADRIRCVANPATVAAERILNLASDRGVR